MRWRSLLSLLPLLAAVAPPAHACSQCLCGMPFPADALGGVVPMQVRYGLEDRYLSKSNFIEAEPGGQPGESGSELEREHRLSAFVLWRPASRWALLARASFNVKEIRETPSGAPAETRRAKGLGDLELLALFGVAHRGNAAVGAVLGVTAPTGSNRLRDDAGERLDTHLQPGTGAWSMTAGWNLAISGRRGGFEGGVLARLNGESSRGYHYGNTWLYNVGYATPERHNLSLLVQVNGRSAARDRLEDATIGENTGGTVVYLAPGFRWRSAPGVGAEVLVQEPVIESLFGNQDEHTVWRFAISLGH